MPEPPVRTEMVTDPLPELEVFAVDDEGRLHGHEDQLPTALDIIRMVRDAARELHDQARSERARTAANRPGPSMLQSDRKGAGDDIIHAVRADPAVAISAMLAGGPLRPPIGGLRVAPASLVADHRGLTWLAWVRPRGSARRRRVRLRVYPSPSTNVTFIELIPDRPRRRRSAAFIRTGARIAESLGNRLLTLDPGPVASTEDATGP